MKQKGKRKGIDEAISVEKIKENSVNSRDSDSSSTKKKAECCNNRRIFYSIILLIFITSIILAIGVPTIILYGILQKMQSDMESLSTSYVDIKSDFLEMDVELMKSRNEIRRLREEMKASRLAETKEQPSDSSCPSINYTEIDQSIQSGTDAQRKSAYSDLVIFNDDPCYENDFDYLSHLAAVYYFQGFIAGEDGSLVNKHLRKKHLTIANSTITRALLIQRNNSRSLKWYIYVSLSILLF